MNRYNYYLKVWVDGKGIIQPCPHPNEGCECKGKVWGGFTIDEVVEQLASQEKEINYA